MANRGRVGAKARRACGIASTRGARRASGTGSSTGESAAIEAGWDQEAPEHQQARQ